MVCLLQNVKGKHALPGFPLCVCTVCPRILKEDVPDVQGPSVLMQSLSTLQRWLCVEATSSDNSCYISLLTSWSWSFRNVH